MFALGCRSRTARPCVVCRLSTVVWRAVRTVATLWHSRTGHTGQAEAPGGGAQGQGAKPLACTMYFVCFSCVYIYEEILGCNYICIILSVM